MKLFVYLLFTTILLSNSIFAKSKNNFLISCKIIDTKTKKIIFTPKIIAPEDEKVSIQLGDNKSKELYFNFEYKINKKDENNFFVDFKPTVIKKTFEKSSEAKLESKYNIKFTKLQRKARFENIIKLRNNKSYKLITSIKIFSDNF